MTDQTKLSRHRQVDGCGATAGWRLTRNSRGGRDFAMVAEELVDGSFVVREAGDGDQAPTLIAQEPVAFTLAVTDVHMSGRAPSTCWADTNSREHAGQGATLRLRMVLTSPDAPALNHVVEHTIPLI